MNTFADVKIGQFIKSKISIQNARTENNWYQRIEISEGSVLSPESKFALFTYRTDNNLLAYAAEPSTWDLENILDSDPTKTDSKLNDLLRFSQKPLNLNEVYDHCYKKLYEIKNLIKNPDKINIVHLKLIIAVHFYYADMHRYLYNMDIDITNNEIYGKALCEVLSLYNPKIKEEIEYLLYEDKTTRTFDVEFEYEINGEIKWVKSLEEFIKYCESL